MSETYLILIKTYLVLTKTYRNMPVLCLVMSDIM